MFIIYYIMFIKMEVLDSELRAHTNYIVFEKIN